MQKVALSERIAVADQPFAKRIIYQDQNVVAFTLAFKPGQALPPHTHEASTVVVLVHAGEGEATVDGTPVPLRQGDVLTVTGKETLSVKNTGAGDLVLYVNMAPRPADPKYVREIG